MFSVIAFTSFGFPVMGLFSVRMLTASSSWEMVAVAGVQGKPVALW